MIERSTQAHQRTGTRQLVVAGLLLCALATPLLGTSLTGAQPGPGRAAPGHGAAQHDARAPDPPAHERHGPRCFLCVLGPVLLVVPPLRLRGRPRAAPEPRLRRDFPARKRPFAPQSRSRAPPLPVRPGLRC